MNQLRPILVCGASGFVGRRLVARLVQNGHPLRCLVRQTPLTPPAGTELVQADLLAPETLPAALAGIDTAYYLVHSLERGRYARLDRDAAQHFVQAAEQSGVRRVIYLGGLGEEGTQLSEHLASRREVETILMRGRFATTALRAGIIIGAGGSSFELMCQLVKRLPLLPAPLALETRCQPIALDDVVAYLAGCLEEEATAGEHFDIGGPQVLSYKELLERIARQSGEVNLHWPVPLATPRLFARLAGLVVPARRSLARSLIAGLDNEVVCREERIRRYLPISLTPLNEAIRLALRPPEHS